MERLTKEDLSFLKELANKIRTQDNCGTRTPLFFQVRETKTRIVPEGYGDKSILVDTQGDYTEYETASDFVDSLDECELEELEDEEVEDLRNMSLSEIAEWAEDHGHDGVKCFSVEEYNTRYGSFLTSDACQKHIDQNHYHYKKPVCYADHVWRNYELERLLEIVDKFGTELKANE